MVRNHSSAWRHNRDDCPEGNRSERLGRHSKDRKATAWLRARLACYRIVSEPPPRDVGSAAATSSSSRKWLREQERNEATDSSDWLHPPKCKDGKTCHEPQGWIINVKEALMAPDLGYTTASAAHYAMRLRKGLADLAGWPRPLLAEARALRSHVGQHWRGPPPR